MGSITMPASLYQILSPSQEVHCCRFVIETVRPMKTEDYVLWFGRVWSRFYKETHKKMELDDYHPFHDAINSLHHGWNGEFEAVRWQSSDASRFVQFYACKYDGWTCDRRGVLLAMEGQSANTTPKAGDVAQKKLTLLSDILDGVLNNPHISKTIKTSNRESDTLYT